MPFAPLIRLPPPKKTKTKKQKNTTTNPSLRVPRIPGAPILPGSLCALCSEDTARSEERSAFLTGMMGADGDESESTVLAIEDGVANFGTASSLPLGSGAVADADFGHRGFRLAGEGGAAPHAMTAEEMARLRELLGDDADDSDGGSGDGAALEGAVQSSDLVREAWPGIPVRWSCLSVLAARGYPCLACPPPLARVLTPRTGWSCVTSPPPWLALCRSTPPWTLGMACRRRRRTGCGALTSTYPPWYSSSFFFLSFFFGLVSPWVLQYANG